MSIRRREQIDQIIKRVESEGIKYVFFRAGLHQAV